MTVLLLFLRKVSSIACTQHTYIIVSMELCFVTTLIVDTMPPPPKKR